MNIKPDVPLAPYTTFQIGGPARLFCSISSEAELVEAVNFAAHNELPIFILGKGSNLLVSDAGFPGLVIKNEIMGIEIDSAQEKDGSVLISAGAGESWDDFVDETVTRGFHGLENLSAIPGTVGAAPVQNIGAYGAEVCTTIDRVRVLDTSVMEFRDLSRDQCAFDYRDSIFKHQKNRYVIVKVTFKLQRGGTTDISYRDLTQYFAQNPPAAGVGSQPTIQEVRDAVIAIRLGKLPDWTHWGTAGSFFKNPVISAEHYADLEKRYPGLPGFPTADGRVKVSLGWILDKICNVKEMTKEGSHVHPYEKQALVLVATPGASAAEVVKLAQDLMAQVKEKTGIEIEGEVEWVN